jgi:hypothetical protein
MAPNWMKTRVAQVAFLRERGVNSALLAHSTERAVEQLFVREKAKESVERKQAE